MPGLEADIEAQVAGEIEIVNPTPPSGAEQKLAAEVKPKETKPAEDDPEVDLDGKTKVKMSELKKGYMQQSDYTKKTQELAAQQKEVAELKQLAGYLKANPKKLERIIAILDEKEAALENKQEQVQEDLSGLDPNDPYAKMLKQQSEKLEKALQEIQSMKQGQEQSKKEELVKSTQQVLNKTLEETVKTLTFEDEEEQAFWKQMVLSHLKDNPKQYANEEDFVNTIKEVGKVYSDKLAKFGEKKIAKYVKTKSGTVPAAPSTPGAPLAKKPSMENLQELIESELGKEEQT